MSLSLSPRELLLLTSAAAAWGVGTVISKDAVSQLAPFTLLAIQLGSSVAVLVLVMRVTRTPLRGSPAVLARLGILNPGIAYALGLAGLASISASLYVLLWALEPLLILVLAGLWLREGVGRRLIGGSALAAAGMVAILAGPAIGGAWVGVALVVAGVLCCAVYTVVVRRSVGLAESTFQVVLAQQAYALVFAVVLAVALALISGSGAGTGTITPAGLLGAMASGILYFATAYWLYLTALRTVPASIAGMSFYLIPVFGVAASWVLLGERLDPLQWAGIAVVGVAIVIVVAQPRSTVPEPAA
jgi:drug/metabolite transporter (DMT)-like permease